MNRALFAAAIGLGVIVVFLVGSAFFVIDPTQQALVLQFGDPVRVVREPGLKFRTPLIQNVVYLDRRVLDIEPPAEEVIAADQKRLVVDSYARFKIDDPLRFYQSVGSESAARERLGAMISGTLRRVLGNVTIADVLSAKRAGIMREITKEVNGEAKSFGVDVVDVRLKRADLPDANSQAIYARMQSERQREAKEFRAQGAEAAQTVRAKAERDRTVILAEAQKQAQTLRGEGDAASIKIYADAFGKDKDFFAFYRSLQAYSTALEGKDTTFVLAPDGDFFRYFGTSAGPAASAKPVAAAPTTAPPASPRAAEAPSAPASAAKR